MDLLSIFASVSRQGREVTRVGRVMLSSAARRVVLVVACSSALLQRCGAMLLSSGAKLPVRLQISRSAATTIRCGPDGQSPEELLLEAVSFLQKKEIERARSNVVEARRICDTNGGPTAEQTQLLELLTSRLPPPKSEPEQPTLAEMFPGTTAAPTGESLKLPGTPSMAELAAKAKEKREAQRKRDTGEA